MLLRSEYSIDAARVFLGVYRVVEGVYCIPGCWGRGSMRSQSFVSLRGVWMELVGQSEALMREGFEGERYAALL